MQGKGLIKLFLVLLIIVTVVQFLYMIPTNRVEADAEAYSEEVAARLTGSESDIYDAKKLAKATYLDSMGEETIVSVPLLKDYTYDDLKQSQLALGLDLKGGMSAVLQVDVRQLIYQLSGENNDKSLRLALDNATARQKDATEDFVALFQQEFAKLDTEKKLARIFLNNSSLREEINVDTDDGAVIRLLRSKVDDTVKNTYDRLRARIDKLGVVQPNVTLDAARDLIVVEMPGMENPARARKFLQAKANLEFWDVYQVEDNGIRSAFTLADQRLKAEKETTTEVDEEAPTTKTIMVAQYDELGNEIDSIEQEVAIEPDFQSLQGPLTSLLQLNGAGGQFGFSPAVMGVASKKDTAAINKYLAQEDIKVLFPANSKFLWGAKERYLNSVEDDGESDDPGVLELFMIQLVPGSNKAVLEGDVIIEAKQGMDVNGLPEVNLRMNSAGAQKWAVMTDRASKAGNRIVAISLDDEVVTAPRVNGPIPGGNTAISGSFTTQEALDLAKILEVGKLPADVDIIQESTVGPSLGKKNIRSSMMAMLIGFLLVLLFMLVYYGGAGIVSIVALFANMVFIFAALASFGTVLTLPGFAGIILTIGMAVDANVIIYERIREELRAGKSNLAAIADGFKNSYSAIIDANVTTILVAAVLFYFGLGPIKGFATVLGIGVISSLFTAVLLSRFMIESWTSKERSMSFWTGMSKNAFANLNIDWLGKRKIAYAISGILLIAGISSMFTKKFDLSIDFAGGNSYTVQFEEEVEAQKLREGLVEYFGTSPTVKEVSSQNTYQIVTKYKIDETGENVANEIVEKLHEGITAITGSKVSKDMFVKSDVDGVTHIVSSSKVGPTIADDIKTSSFYAGIFALLLIFLYIMLRFNKWQYSLGAVAALLHDSLIVLGLFSLLWGIVPFAIEIDQAFIAAILTVIGYSINDTVVLFDRIREDLGIYTNKSKDEVINGAINNTFSRTIITSLTTLLMVSILFIFGGGSIKGFAFALVIGIIVGTYSSIFVATPIVRDLTGKLERGTTEKKKKGFSRASR